MAQYDPNRDWDVVQQDAVERIFGAQHQPCAQHLPESGLVSLLEERGYMLATDMVTEIGRGTYGCVMKVRRKSDGRAFAMKRQTLDLTAASAETVLREIGILNAVSGVEGLIQMEDMSLATAQAGKTCSAELWVILEYFPSNLSDAKNSLRSEWSTRRVIFQLLQGLRALHEADIVHRDLKPGNVLVNVGSNPPFSTRAVICDFGLSRSIGDVHSEFLEISDAMPVPPPRQRRPVSTDVVTAPWRAPELWNWADVGRMSRRDLKSIDVFSLALIWAEMLGGSRVIHSEDGRDPPSLRLLEILRRVDCPDDSVLDELGFADDVVQFVRSVSAEDFTVVRMKFEEWKLSRDSICNQGYVHYLLEEQPYRGIRAWTLRHSPTLSMSSPALTLIEGASRFDYRRRPTAHELLNDAYFFLLHAEHPTASKCQSIVDVGDMLDAEAQVQAAAYKNSDVNEARASVERMAYKIRAEMAISMSKGNDEASAQNDAGTPLCNASCPVLLGKLGVSRVQKCDGQQPNGSLVAANANNLVPKQLHTGHPAHQIGTASPPVQRFRNFSLLQHLSCPVRKQARAMPKVCRGGA